MDRCIVCDKVSAIKYNEMPTFQISDSILLIIYAYKVDTSLEDIGQVRILEQVCICKECAVDGINKSDDV